MKFRELKIDKELRDLLPPQTEEEHKILEQSILKDGCSNPIITWNDYIVDGHNRYSICSEYNIGFEEIKLGYNTKDEIIMWMLENQLGRRNLSDVQRIIIAEKYRSVIETQAKENQGKRTDLTSCLNSSECNNIDTRKELAKIAGVGVEKYYRTNKILKTDNEEIKEKLKNGDISVNKAYTTLFPKKNNRINEKEDFENNKVQEDKELNLKTKMCLKCGQEKEIDNFYLEHEECKECELKKQEILSNETKIINEDYNKLLERKYTVVNIENYNVEGDLNTIKEDCDDFIINLEDRLFDIEKVYERMTIQDKYKFKDIMNNFKTRINEITNKIL